jgi:flavin reductase (DIM6/NTAB) family NADH-FMN oxidoreductase RutF
MADESSVPGCCYFYYPRLVCVLGVRDDAKKTCNFAPVAWTTPLSSEPPLFGVCLSPNTYSHQLVLRTGEFTVNFLSNEHAALAEALGRLSGRDTDKVETLKLALTPGEALSTPSLAVAYVSAECLLLERHHVGDQTLLVGEVQRIHTSPDAFDADGVLRLDQLKPLLYLGSNRYATTEAATLRRPSFPASSR